MKGVSRFYVGAILSFAIALAACGGGNGSAPMVEQPANYNLQAGIANMVTQGLTTPVSLSGTVIVNGVSTPFTGSGTFTRAPAVNGSFNGSAALSQTETISGSVTAAGQSTAYSTSVVDYYAVGNQALLGESSAGEYDVAQAPIDYPGMIVGGSNGVLGTFSRYTDQTMSVSLGTAQLSYSTLTPVDPGSPIGVIFTEKIYDTQNTLTETDVFSFTMDAHDVISFASASAQTPSGTVKINAQ